MPTPTLANPIILVHADTSTTVYGAGSATDVQRGTAAKAACAAVIAGDTAIWFFGGVTYDLGSAGLGNPAISLRANSGSRPLFTSTIDSHGTTTPVINLYSGMLVDNLAVTLPLTGSGVFQVAIGSYGGRDLLGWTINNCAFTGHSDNIYIKCTGGERFSGTVSNCTLVSQWDVTNVFWSGAGSAPVGTINWYNNTHTTTGGFGPSDQSESYAATLQTGTHFLVDSTLHATNDSTGGWGVFASGDAIVEVIHCTITTGSTGTDLTQSSQSVVKVGGGTSYNPAKTSGTITTMATVVVDITTAGAGTHTVSSAVSGNTTIESWGLGGNGYYANSGYTNLLGGGGSEYRKGIFTIAGGTVLDYVVPTPTVPPTQPTDTATSIVDHAGSGAGVTVTAANGNQSGGGSSGVGGSGGTVSGTALVAASGVDHPGGNGSASTNGGAGGSSGCPTSNGHDASGTTGGTSAGTDSGAGGSGSVLGLTPAGNGSFPGGGAGSSSNSSPGTPGGGRIRITYNTSSGAAPGTGSSPTRRARKPLLARGI